jgi:phosphopantetheinyl transferase (holo-ACP synthase)
MANTNRPKVRIHDTETDEVIDRDMTDAEFKEYQDNLAAAQNAATAAAAKEAEKAALLERLGITDDEAKLLLS